MLFPDFGNDSGGKRDVTSRLSCATRSMPFVQWMSVGLSMQEEAILNDYLFKRRLSTLCSKAFPGKRELFGTDVYISPTLGTDVGILPTPRQERVYILARAATVRQLCRSVCQGPLQAPPSPNIHVDFDDSNVTFTRPRFKHSPDNHGAITAPDKIGAGPAARNVTATNADVLEHEKRIEQDEDGNQYETDRLSTKQDAWNDFEYIRSQFEVKRWRVRWVKRNGYIPMSHIQTSSDQWGGLCNPPVFKLWREILVICHRPTTRHSSNSIEQPSEVGKGEMAGEARWG
ncbi:hypothetical protein FISHEDRAFT_63150 [Fistulina hepatica ATCC 64428]|uniref:Uncharacterized protein n=1 Tax=Fistulina hepatica ATCC 64428 TaxID=1128425 RepID=A0A0D6ZZ59_9AGAR|nr:hypothetical protein FISHEDRAFT_63150 [Fistulina hepatica ATCC 64428]